MAVGKTAYGILLCIVQPEANGEIAQPIALEHPLQKGAILVGQLLAYPALLILRLVLVKDLSRHTGAFSLKDDVTYVIYANHQSMLDPLVICASLPVSWLRQLLPFRFFIENAYFKGPGKLLLNSLGGFPAHYQSGTAYGLDKARAVMGAGQTVVIFPPGRRTREPIAKPGISVLATHPNVELIPINIDWKHRWHCSVHIGQPIDSARASSAEELMQHVYDLTPTTT
ncbi:MAG TPA: lysophospholipid acyltransferase family protein [Verrucomicrobiae bacterium]|nr:lysophospholipid acyltransferase family protein [Verrucomicrobiae bacterium]